MLHPSESDNQPPLVPHLGEGDPSTVTLHDETGVFVSLLSQFGCSIALSTDASRLAVIGAPARKPTLSVVALPQLRGLAVRGDYIAAGTADSVMIFKSVAALAPVAPYAPQTFDAIYSPRAIHFTGRCDFHDMAFINGVITAVNTRYSCICTIDGRYNFTPIWKPPFISSGCAISTIIGYRSPGVYLSGIPVRLRCPAGSLGSLFQWHWWQVISPKPPVCAGTGPEADAISEIVVSPIVARTTPTRLVEHIV